MTTANEKLLDEAVRHQIFLLRHQASANKEMVKLLARVEARILSELARGDISNYSSARKQALLKRLNKLIKELYAPVKKAIRQEVRELAKHEVQHQSNIIKSTIPLIWETAVPSANQLRAAISKRPYQGKYMAQWLGRMGPAAATRVIEAIQSGFTEGRTTDDIVRSIKGTAKNRYKDGVLEISRRSAQMVTRTTLNHTATVARGEFYEQNTDLIKGVRWVSTLDNRTSKICASRDGKVYDVKDGPRPPAHPNCRSTTVPVLKSWRELGINLKEAPEGTRASLDGQVPQNLTYGDWLHKQPVAMQNEVLGVRASVLFRKGGLPVERFVDRRGNALTLDQLKKHESKAWRDAGFQ